MYHKYYVVACDSEGMLFQSICTSSSIINAIEMYHQQGYSVQSITKGNQVPRSSCEKIGNIQYINQRIG